MEGWKVVGENAKLWKVEWQGRGESERDRRNAELYGRWSEIAWKRMKGMDRRQNLYGRFSEK